MNREMIIKPYQAGKARQLLPLQLAAYAWPDAQIDRKGRVVFYRIQGGAPEHGARAVDIHRVFGRLPEQPRKQGGTPPRTPLQTLQRAARRFNRRSSRVLRAGSKLLVHLDQLGGGRG